MEMCAFSHPHIPRHPFLLTFYLAVKPPNRLVSAATPSPSPPSLLEQVIGGAGSFVLSQIPAGLVVTGIYPFSLYQPGIYHSAQWFLLIPFGLTLAALFVVAKWLWTFWLFLAAFLIFGGCVAWIYFSFPAEHYVHMVNWILSYCTIGLLAVLLFRVYLYARLRM